MVQEIGVQSQVDSYQNLKKCYLTSLWLTLSIIRYGSRVNWFIPWKEVVTSSTPWCSNYRKGNLWVNLDYGRQLYWYIYIYIYTILLSTSIHSYQEKEKKRQNLEITLSRITARGKKKKNYFGKKNNERANFVTPVEKNQEICSP